MSNSKVGVATPRLCGGRLFKWKGKIVSAAPAALLAQVSMIALTTGIAQADSISTVLTTPQVTSADEDHEITSTGAVEITSTSAPALTIETDYSSTATNNGTISVTGSAIETATGLLLDGELLETGVLVNNGTIALDVTGTSPRSIIGIKVANDSEGLIENTGTISIEVLGTEGEAIARGIYVEGDVSSTGQILNSGVINIDALNTGGSTAFAYGIHISGDLEGSIMNSGTIDVQSRAFSHQNGLAWGILVDGNLADTGRIDNTDTIKSVAITSVDSSAHAYGIEVDGNANGVIANSGTLDVLASAPNYYGASAYGIVVGDNLSGRIENSGTINVSAIAGESSALAYGIRVSENVLTDATVFNSGTITAFASTDTDDRPRARGISVDDLVEGRIENAGKITGTAKSLTSANLATASGIYIRKEVSGTVINSGTMTLRAEAAESYASAAGIYLNGTLSGSVTNSGTVTASAISTGAKGNAYGVFESGEMTGDISNSGSIIVSAQSGSDTGGPYPNEAEALGVYANNMTGTFSNSGLISAHATGSSGTRAVGVEFNIFNGTIDGLGTIQVSSNDEAYAVYLGTGTGTLNASTEDDVEGLIRVNEHNVALDARGGSAVFRFEDAAPDSGSFTTTVSDEGSAWFVQDEGGAAPVYAAVDGADFAVSSDVVAFYGSVVGSSGNALNYNQSPQVAQGGVIAGVRPYAAVDFQRRDFESEAGVDTDVTLYGGSAGFTGQLDSGLAMALSMGVFSSDGDTDTTDFDTTGFYLDAAFGRQFGAYTVEGGLGYAWLSTDRTRQIDGSSDADAEYDSRLITANVAVKRAFDVSSDFGLLGFADVRYTNQKDDGYTETGSSANATVGDVTTEVIEAHLGVEAEAELAGGVLTGQVSGVVRRGLGESDADVTVFSTTETLIFASNDFTGGSLAVGYEKEVARNTQLEVNVEQEIGSNAQGPFARFGLQWAF
ncbi:autotransporter outer membrane beta-barrel domain-containing protein [Ruegeria sp. SCP11]|uniref:autotransporter outer membrane beta-barrel domain-containing protein n=1 Tax=Ruegeria sp. SCP11 TaxID=3141378 RepID=UPI003336F885